MKPLCEVCGDRHESHQAHRFATNKIIGLDYGLTTTCVVANVSVANTPLANETVANKKSKYKDPEARKRYMREYMRRRRGKVAQ